MTVFRFSLVLVIVVHSIIAKFMYVNQYNFDDLIYFGGYLLKLVWQTGKSLSCWYLAIWNSMSLSSMVKTYRHQSFICLAASLTWERKKKPSSLGKLDTPPSSDGGIHQPTLPWPLDHNNPKHSHEILLHTHFGLLVGVFFWVHPKKISLRQGKNCVDNKKRCSQSCTGPGFKLTY